MIKQGLVIVAAWGWLSTAGAAQDYPPLDVNFSAGVVSDLRDRGLSMSGKNFAPVTSLSFYHESGFYGGVFGATNLDIALKGGKATSETEFYAGYSFESNGYVYDFSAEMDLLLGDATRGFSEFKGQISRDFGLAYIKAGVAYAPNGRWSIPGGESLYTHIGLEVPVPTMPDATVIARYGYDARFGSGMNGKDVRDWALGASYFFDKLELSVMLEDSSDNRRLLGEKIGSTAIVLGAKLYF